MYGAKRVQIEASIIQIGNLAGWSLQHPLYFLDRIPTHILSGLTMIVMCLWIGYSVSGEIDTSRIIKQYVFFYSQTL